jgi:C1A family cysteine protease
MANDTGAIAAVDSAGSTTRTEEKTDTVSAQDQERLSTSLDQFIMSSIFFTFSTMSSLMSEGMRQQSSFLSEISQESSE